MKGAIFYMKITLEEKIKMCEEHIIKGKSLSHISEMYGGYNISNLKYIINLYKKHGKKIFEHKEIKAYKRDTKLLAIA